MLKLQNKELELKNEELKMKLREAGVTLVRLLAYALWNKLSCKVYVLIVISL